MMIVGKTSSVTMANEAQIREYVVGLEAYYAAIWAAVLPEDRATHFSAIDDYLHGLDGETLPQNVPANILAHLPGETNEAKREALEALMGARHGLRAKETGMDADEQIRGRLVRVIRNELEGRFLNTATVATEAGEVGTFNAEDRTAAVEVGTVTQDLLTPTIEPERAREILQRWIQTVANNEGQASLQVSIRQALGLEAGTDITNFEVTEANTQRAITAFQNAKGITPADGNLTPETIRALRNQDLDRSLDGRRWLDSTVNAVRGFFSGNGGSGGGGEQSQEGGDSRTGGEEGNGIWGQIQNWFGGLGDALGNTSAGGWVGGLLGVGLSWFISNMFGEGMFRTVLLVALAPMMFMLGRNMGQNFGGGDERSQSGDEAARAPAVGQERVQETGGPSQASGLTPEEVRAMFADRGRLPVSTAADLPSGPTPAPAPLPVGLVAPDGAWIQ